MQKYIDLINNQGISRSHRLVLIFKQQIVKKGLIFGQKSQFICQFKWHLTWKIIISSNYNNFDNFLTK